MDDGAHRTGHPPQTTIRPRHAGTLLIIDESTRIPAILMGRRAAHLAFMPGKYVFPGGRTERADLRLACRFTLAPASRNRLLAATSASFDDRHATAIALSAVRETFEEVGMLVGKTGEFTADDALYAAFANAGVVPDPASLAPIARAITPPGHVRRYDTRFFCVSADAVAASTGFAERQDDEFDHVEWFSLDRLDALDLPGITRQVLADIDGRLRDGSWRDTSRAMPFYRTRHGRPVREMI